MSSWCGPAEDASLLFVYDCVSITGTCSWCGRAEDALLLLVYDGVSITGTCVDGVVGLKMPCFCLFMMVFPLQGRVSLVGLNMPRFCLFMMVFPLQGRVSLVRSEDALFLFVYDGVSLTGTCVAGVVGLKMPRFCLFMMVFPQGLVWLVWSG